MKAYCSSPTVTALLNLASTTLHGIAHQMFSFWSSIFTLLLHSSAILSVSKINNFFWLFSLVRLQLHIKLTKPFPLPPPVFVVRLASEDYPTSSLLTSLNSSLHFLSQPPGSPPLLVQNHAAGCHPMHRSHSTPDTTLQFISFRLHLCAPSSLIQNHLLLGICGHHSHLDPFCKSCPSAFL